MTAILIIHIEQEVINEMGGVMVNLEKKTSVEHPTMEVLVLAG